MAKLRRHVARWLATLLGVVLIGGGGFWLRPIRVRHSHIPNLDICTVEGPDERYPMGFCFGHGIVIEWRWGGWH